MEGQGTELNIYRLIKKVDKLIKEQENNKTWILFLDFAKAYDMVN